MPRPKFRSFILVALAAILATGSLGCSSEDCDIYGPFVPDPLCDDEEEAGDPPEPRQSLAVRVGVSEADAWVGETLLVRLEEELDAEVLLDESVVLDEPTFETGFTESVLASRPVRLAARAVVDLDGDGTCDPDEPSWHAQGEMDQRILWVRVVGTDPGRGCS